MFSNVAYRATVYKTENGAMKPVEKATINNIFYLCMFVSICFLAVSNICYTLLINNLKCLTELQTRFAWK